jgi:tetratricopeptide (TPR) repeat protein
VRARLAPSLEARPKRWPTDAAILDRYEALIEHTYLAGRAVEAVALYKQGLGYYEHLSKSLGENTRGIRVLTLFSTNGTVTGLLPSLPASDRWDLLTDWGLYAKNLGDLATARRAFELTLTQEPFSAAMTPLALENLANVVLLTGCFPEARQIALRAWESSQGVPPAAYLARALAALGEVGPARQWYSTAASVHGGMLGSGPGLWEAELALKCGDIEAARRQTQANRAEVTHARNLRMVALCDALLGHLVLGADLAAAKNCLSSARDFGSRSGEVQVQLRCYHLASEIAAAEKAFDLAQSEAEAGIHLADTCAFGEQAIELRLALARAHLGAGDPKIALPSAAEALERSTHPQCQYAWGEADSLYLCGVAQARLGDVNLAREHLSRAVGKQKQLTHRGLAKARAELARLGR